MNRLPVKFHDLGTPKEMKPIPRPPHVFAIEWVESGRVELLTQPYLQWSSRPTVAILPFRTIGGTDDDSYFGEGITDEIITGLSRSRSLFVIARSSTLRYRNRTKNLHQIAAELQVRYLLDGSVQRLGGRLRINAELIDTVTDRPIWTQRYEGATDRLFEFQDQIAGSILASLEPSVQAAEVSHVRDHPTESLDAYHCLLRGLYRLYFLTEESHREAGELFERAISLDPSYARAHAHLAWWLNFSIGEGWSQDPDKDRARAMNVSQHAVTLDGADPFVLTVAGHTLAYLQKRLNEALELFDKALALDQNSAFAWGLSALTLAYLGRADEALERLENLWRLNPFDPLIFFYWTVAGVAEFVAGRYNEAISWLRKSRRANPQFRPCLRTLAASLALSDDAKETQEEARAVAKALLEIEPSFSVSKFVAWYPLRPPDDLARLATGLRTAGLPD
jgi:TolB-like protein